ncbi:zinc finger protein 888-like [Apis laboriosa]|uniref:zinc finger protein 888-like n=1 Tax=Apis laboriosa TaxID=183418 RepID=UPI001CC6D4CE|nr:zinc finger protein 888-like [Apis laboriosa]XP_043801033.1 zinc finger protein 888-like [Apis laboriosa]
MGRNKDSETDSVLSEFENEVKNIKTTEREKPYKCSFVGCNLAFYRPSRLQRHIRFHTGEKNYKCNYPGCDKAYTNNCHLKRHMKNHSIKKALYKCPECSLYISNRDNLKRHYKRIHDRLTCKKCNETFIKKYQLKIHMTTQHLVSYKCNECNKNFTNLTKFKRHESSHKKSDKQYSCNMPECNEVFKKWLLLCAHIKTQHVRDHKCKDCDKIFLTKRHLKIHSKVHMENRSVLSCPYEKCPRVYYFNWNLKQHIRTYHLGEKYECDICKIKIVNKKRLAEHIQKLHMSEKRIKQSKKLRKKRKDAGLPKKSTASKLIGINLSPEMEKIILERKEDIIYEQFKMVPSDDLDCN